MIPTMKPTMNSTAATGARAPRRTPVTTSVMITTTTCPIVTLTMKLTIPTRMNRG